MTTTTSTTLHRPTRVRRLVGALARVAAVAVTVGATSLAVGGAAHAETFYFNLKPQSNSSVGLTKPGFGTNVTTSCR
jgi:hypothetical protein